MRFAGREQFAFWSNGAAFGRCRISANGGGWEVALSCSEGRLELDRFDLDGVGKPNCQARFRLRPGNR